MTQKVIDPLITKHPSCIKNEAFLVPKEKRIEEIEKRMKEILEILGLDLSDPSLEKTPHRIAKMYVEELFSGLDPNNFPSITFQEEELFLNQTMIVKDISFISICEHHLIPMIGKAHVAYIPRSKVIGLSKIHRLVHFFASRPQIQERVTAQIADSLSILLDSEDVAVVIEAMHTCVLARGVHDQTSNTLTEDCRGAFSKDPNLRADFFKTIGINEEKTVRDLLSFCSADE